MKMAVYFEHQCGLLKALQAATTPYSSFVSKPRVGVVDLELLPFSMFPVLGPDEDGVPTSLSTYQDKVNDGLLSLRRCVRTFCPFRNPEVEWPST
jgi:hypothetical protein